MPFVHAKLAYTYFNIESVVGINTNVSLAQVFAHHVFVDLLAAFDFGDQLPTCVGKFAQEALVPHLRIRICILGSSSSADANKYSYFTTGPLVDHSFVQSFWAGVESADAIVMENRLPDGDRLEGKSDRASGPASLPDFAVKLRWGFFSRIVRS